MEPCIIKIIHSIIGQLQKHVSRPNGNVVFLKNKPRNTDILFSEEIEIFIYNQEFQRFEIKEEQRPFSPFLYIQESVSYQN